MCKITKTNPTRNADLYNIGLLKGDAILTKEGSFSTIL